jgi:membrane dipeptidase
LGNFRGHINLQNLKSSGCIAQCFAVFTEGENAANVYNSALNNFNKTLKDFPDILTFSKNYTDILSAIQSGKCAAILTVENLGFLHGDLAKISQLKAQGVSMASLVWNNQNDFAYPNVQSNKPAYREQKGLKERGRQVIYELQKNKIIIDVSHLSDGGFYDVLNLTQKPFVASHSNCTEVCNVSRNLTDDQIKKLADRGGVMGINFSKNFLGDGGYQAVLAHVKHAVNVGGEDVISIGSDFDGTTTPNELCGCQKVDGLLNYLLNCGLSPRLVDKFAYANFLRVFREVMG